MKQKFWEGWTRICEIILALELQYIIHRMFSELIERLCS